MGTRQNIPQTYRTILFEEFDSSDDEKKLSMLLNPNISPDSDYRNRSIDEKLGVKSFKEFLEKFSPAVYEYFVQDGDGQIQALYTLDKKIADDFGAVPISIADHAYFKMLSELYDRKGTSGQSNIKFDDTKIKEILTPEKEIKTAYNLRGELATINRRLEKAVAEKQTAKVKFFEKSRAKCLERISKAYGASKIKLLPIAHDDITRQIKIISDRIADAEKTSSSGEQQKLLTGRMGFNEHGNLVVLPAPKTETLALANQSDAKSLPPGSEELADKKLIALVGQDYDAKVDSDDGYTRSLILSVYANQSPANFLDGLDKDELIARRDELISRQKSYEAVLAQSKESFIRTMNKIIQKMLGVKIFFDHATLKGELSPKLLVANCKVEDLLDDEVKDEFTAFVEHRGKIEGGNNKIWFAILPQVDGGYEPDYFDEDGALGVDFDLTKTFLEIMNDAGIMTVFSLLPTRETTFSGISGAVIDELKEKFDNEGVNHEHAVFAYPNFTLMQEGEVPISNAPDAATISVPAVYVDAAYVAAGILVASQQPLYLKKHGFANRVDEENACVRVNLEDEELVNSLTTHLNPEMAYTWTKDITDAIADGQFGFAFCSNSKFNHEKNTYLKNAYILCARTLFKEGKYYQPIYRRLTKDFIIAYIKARFSANPKKDVLKTELPKIVGQWRKEFQSATTKDNINLILREGEDVQYDTPENPNELLIKFTKYDEIISADELTVISENVGEEE